MIPGKAFSLPSFASVSVQLGTTKKNYRQLGSAQKSNKNRWAWITFVKIMAWARFQLSNLCANKHLNHEKHQVITLWRQINAFE